MSQVYFVNAKNTFNLLKHRMCWDVTSTDYSCKYFGYVKLLPILLCSYTTEIEDYNGCCQ